MQSVLKLERSLSGHAYYIAPLAWSPDGKVLASGSGDNTIRIWGADDGKAMQVLRGHSEVVSALAWSPDGQFLASGSADRTVRIWNVAQGQTIHVLTGHDDFVRAVAWLHDGSTLLSGSEDETIRYWDTATGAFLRLKRSRNAWVLGFKSSPDGRWIATAYGDGTIRIQNQQGEAHAALTGHADWVDSVSWSPDSKLLASGSGDKTIRIWDLEAPLGRWNRRTRAVWEGHTARLRSVSFSHDGRLLASKADDDTVKIWDVASGAILESIPEKRGHDYWPPVIAFHPHLPLLATLDDSTTQIRLWSVRPPEKPAVEVVRHTTAKIVLVGDSGVGKTGLGWRLAQGEFKEHPSTHGQQFWVLKPLGARRADATECEAILWDLAGQPDYRLTHALFLDNADLALILFDPTDSRDPLHGVEFWLKQLQACRTPLGDGSEEAQACPQILVGARADRGEARLTAEELDAYCRDRGIRGGYIATSALRGAGLDELLLRMKALVSWDQKPATVTTATFKRIKDYLLELKEMRKKQDVLVSPAELKAQIQSKDGEWSFTDADMMTAVRHLANYGYVHVLRTSGGEERVLLAPELLNNLAASFVLEARRNPKGLGSLEEKRLLAGQYPFPELETLSLQERETLLDSTAHLFLRRNICFRESDPLGGRSYLVFPELINLKKPALEQEERVKDGVSYTVSGAVENVYSSLVVLLGYTPMFTRTDQWRKQSRYVFGDKLICGFRLEAERDGELDFVLFFGANVDQPVRTLFQGLFESFLFRRNLTVYRYEPVLCPSKHVLNRLIVREQSRAGKHFAFCPECGKPATLAKADEPISLELPDRRNVNEQRLSADRRSGFEQALFQVASYVERRGIARPQCFISYAWGDRDQELWVERSLAADLVKAGIVAILDRWETRYGGSLPRYIERIEKCDKIVVVGTTLYRKKYDNRETDDGYVVAAEGALISNRLLGTDAQKESVIPLLLEGEKAASLPPLLHDRVFADFRTESRYFATAFDLILSLYGIPFHEPAFAGLRESLEAGAPQAH